MNSEKKKLSLVLNRIIKEMSSCISINEIRLFGSQLLKPNSKSDIDLVIFCIDNFEYNEIIKKLGMITCEYNQFIHPIIYDYDINRIKKNNFIKENILNKSKIIFKPM